MSHKKPAGTSGRFRRNFYFVIFIAFEQNKSVSSFKRINFNMNWENFQQQKYKVEIFS
jgi:hypothetical protein